MGKGDVKTAKGKIKKGSFGNSRPAKPFKHKKGVLKKEGEVEAAGKTTEKPATSKAKAKTTTTDEASTTTKKSTAKKAAAPKATDS